MSDNYKEYRVLEEDGSWCVYCSADRRRNKFETKKEADEWCDKFNEIWFKRYGNKPWYEANL